MQDPRNPNENASGKNGISIQTKDKVEAAKAYIESYRYLAKEI